ncbi:nickel ABC transporter substrate-binding protein [Cohnella lupini]|uniref:Peptide/nickel transport system substrate-binding protein n=1 Tax=Cohnella lupini TaxID=1294267 RepID=A0A3D9ING4_9BACL|nr:nickel ABC transporter substrate-binding protein [Cohnella lupini]RED63265.1 peptide/nickel transport system substrate-binding protein [Cohnella lupini]
MKKRSRMFRIQIGWLTAALATIVLLSGCGSNETAANAPSSSLPSQDAKTDVDKQVTVAVAADPALDQLDAGAYKGAIEVHPMVYDSLVEYGEKGSIVPSLAESWDISEDGKTYTFHLRQGVVFSDGTAFNADAVKFSFDRWIGDPANSSLNVSKGLKEIKVIDEATIRFEFGEAYYPLLTELTFARPVRIISPTAVEPAGDPKGKFAKPIGTGAWVVDSYEKDQEAVLVRNPNYWGEAPRLSKIILKVIPDAQARVLALQSGSVDIAGGQSGKIPAENLELLKSDDKLSIQRSAGTSSHFLIYNYDRASLQDVNVRQAINLAIDKKGIVDKLLEGAGSEAHGLFPLTVPYVTESNNEWYGYDEDRARQLLREAGYADSDGDGIMDKDGKPLELSLVLQQTEYPEWKPIAEYVQAQLLKAGIRIRLRMLESNAYYDALWTSREYDLIIYRTYSDAYNPHAFLLSLFHSTGDTPAVAWSDSLLESLIDEAVASTDIRQRQAKYDAWFKRAREQAIYAPLYYPDDIYAVNKRVKNFKLGYASFSPIVWNELDVSK